jgi:hypothetical protein
LLCKPLSTYHLARGNVVILKRIQVMMEGNGMQLVGTFTG